MKRYLLVLLSLLVTGSILGQSRFGLRADLGISRSYGRQDELKMHPAAQGGIFYELDLGQKSILGGKLMFTQIEIKDEDKGHVTAGNYTYFIATRTNYHLSYLSIPLYYGFKFNSISVNLGVEPSYHLINASNRKTETLINGVKNTTISNYSSFSNLFDIGTRIGVVYHFNDKLNLEVQYYLDLNKIIGDDIYQSYTDRVDQLTIGIAYILHERVRQ